MEYLLSYISGAINSGVPKTDYEFLLYNDVAKPKSPILISFVIVLTNIFSHFKSL